ncbi:MAG: tetratricopeptide repeat protein, partial [Phycisphaerae bacterium]|nr:tetratricopeptide repeat protein [Phycisphaerae bacterium]
MFFPSPLIAVEAVIGTTAPHERGRTALLSGDYAQAVKLLEEAVAGEPGHLGYRLLLARAYELSGRADQAEAALLEIVKRQPQHHEAAMGLARRCFQRQEYDRVVKLLEPPAADAKDYELCHLLGTALHHEKKLDQARRYLSQAIARDASHCRDHRLLGDIAMAQGRFALASEAYAQALHLSPGDASLHFKLAGAYFKARNYLGKTRRRVVEGGEPGTIHQVGYLLDPVPGEVGMFYVTPPCSAVFHAQKAHDLGLDCPELHLLLGDIWLEVRRYRRALLEYRGIEGRVPQQHRADYHYSYARAELAVGDPQGYLAHLKKAVEINRSAYGPFLEQAYAKVAEFYNQEGNLPQYIHYLELAVKSAPESSDLRFRLGNALWESGRREDAVRQWRITLELRGNHPDRERMLQLI